APVPADAPAKPAKPVQPAPAPQPADDAPDCNRGGGSSHCNPVTGDYDVDAIDTTCCNSDCTTLHEGQHVTDSDNWGCCKELATRIQNGGDPDCHVAEFEKWRKQIVPITECHAYTVSVACADDLAKKRGCNT